MEIHFFHLHWMSICATFFGDLSSIEQWHFRLFHTMFSICSYSCSFKFLANIQRWSQSGHCFLNVLISFCLSKYRVLHCRSERQWRSLVYRSYLITTIKVWDVFFLHKHKRESHKRKWWNARKSYSIWNICAILLYVMCGWLWGELRILRWFRIDNVCAIQKLTCI